MIIKLHAFAVGARPIERFSSRVCPLRGSWCGEGRPLPYAIALIAPIVAM